MSDYNWSNKDVYKLIEMFKAREVLWNTMLEDRDRNKKHDAWIEIANEFNMDKRVIERKIRSLVGQFNRECKTKFGVGAENSSRWFAFKKLMFLRGKNKPSSTVDGGLQVTEDKSNDSANTPTLNETENNLNETPVEEVFTSPKSFRKRKRPEQEDSTQQKALEILKNLCETKKDNRDECDSFGEYVSMKLKVIKNNYARNTAQHHINNILYNASIGLYDSPKNMSYPTASNSGGNNFYNYTPSPFAVSESHVAYSATRCFNAPSPLVLPESSPTDSFRVDAGARTRSPSDCSESSQDSKHSLKDLLKSIRN